MGRRSDGGGRPPHIAPTTDADVASLRNTPDRTGERRYLAALPEDAVAIIEPLDLGPPRGGRARKGRWRLRFRPRTPPFLDPLTGWTGGQDTLTQIDLQFPSREAAERYCLRVALPFEVRGGDA